MCSQAKTGRTIDDWFRETRELTRQETCLGACKASQRPGCWNCTEAFCSRVMLTEANATERRPKDNEWVSRRETGTT